MLCGELVAFLIGDKSDLHKADSSWLTPAVYRAHPDRWQELEVVGHLESVVRKPREMDAPASACSFLLMQPVRDPSPDSGTAHLWVGLLA